MILSMRDWSRIVMGTLSRVDSLHGCFLVDLLENID